MDLGQVFFSILVEFWLTDADEPMPLPPSAGGGPVWQVFRQRQQRRPRSGDIADQVMLDMKSQAASLALTGSVAHVRPTRISGGVRSFIAGDIAAHA